MPPESVYDSRDLRRALSRFATGVAVVTTVTPEGQYDGLAINSFSSVSLSPPLILWNLAKSSSRLGLFQTVEHFAVNLLSAAQENICQRFARPGQDRFAGLSLEIGQGGVPVLAGGLGHFECQREALIEGGDHLIIIGRVLRYRHDPAGDPLIFCNGAYRAWSGLEKGEMQV
jgi:4-hydroxyphenylacetate 3-hydroxylase, reductase component